MTPPAPASPATAGLLRASLTLLAGGAAAQAMPLMLGPLLTRLYSPSEFGTFHVFAAVAANLAVVGCGRYEFALPLARSDGEAHALRRLALGILLIVTALCLPIGLIWAVQLDASWPLALPLTVASAGLLSLATLWATRQQRFKALAAGRMAQHTGTTLAQLLGGWLHWGVHGLIAGGVAAALTAVALLRLPLGQARSAELTAAPSWRDVARQHRHFPLLNTPHAFASALQDTLAFALIATTLGPAAAGFWGLAMRYLKAPATLIGGAVSQALYPKLAAAGEVPLGGAVSLEARQAVRRVMLILSALALPLVALLWALGAWLFEWFFGNAWHEAGLLAQALALYIGVHFVAAPLAVVTMAWNAQAWALRLALVGQVVFVGALALGAHWGGLIGAGWAVSLAMLAYFGYYFWALATWPITPTSTATKAAS
ncbi:lipopolysaccharide biosynthesis protein [Leptothrix ochracea]|uniref:lipopolysaccharide biosynthesis protein n=1 Tax=Leptothrix ochracea TaxID=735331 RepID=UPI0034E2742D